MTDIKMSEVFGDQLPLHTSNFGGVHSDFIEGFIRLSEDIDYPGNESTVKKIESAIAHAINQHDKLVEVSEDLRQTLKSANNHNKQLLGEKRKLEDENLRLLCLLQRLAETASECDNWESFPSPILDEAFEVLNRT